ncbi:hypothetical protein ABC347_14500 [Sphingomonas sp. 1P06PA]|uniref:hypothetical protein n=1 Tax=Sphingomonas sp. 1P06PA TaxID=554121 RepID=UPI0039A5C2B7
MRATLPLIAIGLIAATPAGAGPDERAARDAERLKEYMAASEAGPPRNCINLTGVRSTKIIDETMIVYEVSSKLRYVNRPPGGCAALRPNRSLVTRSVGSLLCSGDIAQVMDLRQGFGYGACPLGDFTPYRKR